MDLVLTVTGITRRKSCGGTLKNVSLQCGGIKKTTRFREQPLLPKSKEGSTILRRVIESMRNDEISRKVKSDNTILAFGEKLCTKRGHDEKQHNYIRQKLREVGRLLKDMRSCPGNVE
ncbi:hypothetical protein DPMN_027262 [Dreissena polymorpha]|uniref:Uncharacterized protein n=1 Tax=Dreissena polymorpha TaxID=45954 RepID=A0A9D4LUF0_DREPO|nr:hypothetical protein DPMN_027262 [Dreissena polymorpha]